MPTLGNMVLETGPAARSDHSVVTPESEPKKVTFYGHFGTLNTGNESTLLAVVSNLRERHPEWKLACACTYPAIVEERLGIEGFPLGMRDVKLWEHRMGLIGRIKRATAGVIQELREWVAAYRALEGTTTLLIPGTGLLTDAYGLSDWGPYNLFKWSSMARLRGCGVRFLSVGVGPLYSRLGRRFVRFGLGLAHYRSYRDEASMAWARQIGVRTDRDRLYPDLAFSLPSEILPVAGPPGGRRVVGLGLMLYAGRYSAARPKPETYPIYLESLVTTAEWLLRHDYDIRLLLGDEDPLVTDEFKSLLRARLGDHFEGRVVEGPMRTVEEVLAQLASTDVVIATRFHNLVLALLLDKPVLAISFHHKCTSLMSQVGLSEYCHDIHEMDAERLIAQFERLESDSDTVRRRVARRVEEFRTALQEQYDFIARDI